MSQDARVYSIMVEHDRAVPMIEQTTDRAKLDHDLIVPITTCEECYNSGRVKRVENVE